jgi:hypothetical protein
MFRRSGQLKPAIMSSETRSVQAYFRFAGTSDGFGKG